MNDNTNDPEEIIIPDDDQSQKLLAWYTAVKPEEDPQPLGYSLRELLEPVGDTEYLTPLRLMQSECFTILAGKAGSGKSFLAMEEAIQIATRQGKPLKVLYLATDAVRSMRRRFQRRFPLEEPRGQELLNTHLLVAPHDAKEGSRNFVANIANAQTGEQLLAMLDNWQWDCVIVDTFAAMNKLAGPDMYVKDANDASQVNKALAPWRQVVQETGKPVMILHHMGKDEDKGTRGSSAFVDNPEVVKLVKGKPGQSNWRISDDKQRDGEPLTLTGVVDFLTARVETSVVEHEQPKQEAPLNERITTLLEANPEGLNKGQIAEAIGGRRVDVLAAINEMAEAGMVVKPDKRGGKYALAAV